MNEVVFTKALDDLVRAVMRRDKLYVTATAQGVSDARTKLIDLYRAADPKHTSPAPVKDLILCPDCGGRTTLPGQDGWGHNITYGCSLCNASGYVDRKDAHISFHNRIANKKAVPGSYWEGRWDDYVERHTEEFTADEIKIAKGR